MRKFKHKITGKIAEQRTVFGVIDKENYNVEKLNGYLPKEFIENSNDWEEVIEKDYEILSLTIHDDRLSDMTGYGSEYIEALLKDRLNKIHSVKRILDGEIFTIGDKTNGGTIKQIVLCGLEVCGEKRPNFIHIVYEHDLIGSKYPEFKDIQHTKKPLFTTEDGVDIFEGDDYYSIHTTQFNFPNGYGKPTIKGTAIKGYWITFSTKEAAEEYVLMNKPKYSLNDIMNAYDRANCSFIRRDLLQEELKKLNK